MYLRVIFISVFILSFTSTIFLHGCSSNQIVKMDTLIYNKDNVDFAQIKSEWASSTGVAESKGSRTLDNPGEINVILNKIENINVKKLSPMEDVKFMMKDRQVYEEHLTVDLLKEGEIIGKTGTIFKVWPDGSIYIIDIKSMASNERTISYLATEKHPDFYQLLSRS